MAKHLFRNIAKLSLEEKILNTSSTISLVFTFFPWIGGEWLGGEIVSFNGFGFFTSFIGLAVFLLHSYIILTTLIPITGGPQILSKNTLHSVRMYTGFLATILTISAWSVLTKFTFEFSRMQIHYGIYGTMISSAICGLYAFLLYQEQKRHNIHSLFHLEDSAEDTVMPPPAPEEPEEHRIY